MQHLTDRRVASCIQFASDVIEERTGWKLPVPRPMASKDQYTKQLEEEKINLLPITEIEDSCLILYKGSQGYHVGVYIDDMNRVVHGAARGKSVASRISEMNRIYNVVAMYRVQGGQPGEFDENLHKAELFDPASMILVAITALAAGTLIKNWLDRDFNLPESEPENTRNLVGGQNQTRPDQALPWTAGRIRAYPDFSIPPYNRYIGRANDQGGNNAPVQEYRTGLNFGVGRLRLDQLRLGETDFLQFLAFDSPNSFDVVGAANERPPYWEGNVGGARSRTESFSVFSELDYRGPGFLQFTTGSGGGGLVGESFGALGGGITDTSESAQNQAFTERVAERLEAARLDGEAGGLSPITAVENSIHEVIGDLVAQGFSLEEALEEVAIAARFNAGNTGGDAGRGDLGGEGGDGQSGSVGGGFGNEFGQGDSDRGGRGGGGGDN